jgi:hypothetical protein
VSLHESGKVRTSLPLLLEKGELDGMPVNLIFVFFLILLKDYWLCLLFIR